MNQDVLLGLLPSSGEVPPRSSQRPPVEDGKDVEDKVGGYLDYLSDLCGQLGVPDIVEEYFSPVVGRWNAMHEEAGRWRAAGIAADEVTASLNKPLGALDAAWSGETADSFVAYMQKVGLAGNDMSDAMTAMADVLDKTADGIREIVMEMGAVLADTAESGFRAVSNPVGGEERARQHIETMRKPIREFFESVRQVLEAFVTLCDGVDGSKAFEQVKMAHTFPADNWTADIGVPASGVRTEAAGGAVGSGGVAGGAGSGVAGSGSGGGSGGSGSGSGGAGAGSGGAGGVGGPGVGGSPPVSGPPGPGAFTAVGEVPPAGPSGPPAAASAGAGAGSGKGGSGGMGMMAPPMMMGAAPGGGAQEHSNKTRVVADPGEVFGVPAEEDVFPAVIGDED